MKLESTKGINKIRKERNLFFFNKDIESIIFRLIKKNLSLKRYSQYGMICCDVKLIVISMPQNIGICILNINGLHLECRTQYALKIYLQMHYFRSSYLNDEFSNLLKLDSAILHTEV